MLLYLSNDVSNKQKKNSGAYTYAVLNNIVLWEVQEVKTITFRQLEPRKGAQQIILSAMNSEKKIS